MFAGLTSSLREACEEAWSPNLRHHVARWEPVGTHWCDGAQHADGLRIDAARDLEAAESDCASQGKNPRTDRRTANQAPGRSAGASHLHRPRWASRLAPNPPGTRSDTNR